MAPTTRRNGKSQPTTMQATSAPSNSSLRRASFFDPSPYLLLIYPTILALGSLYSTISPLGPPSHSTAFTPGISSDINTPSAPEALSYFAGKHNAINLYFVKVGWFWTTLAFILLHFTTNLAKSTKPPALVSTISQAALRYAIVTITWIITTQWYFGPALIDRSFTITGGQCDALPDSLTPESATSVASISTSMACKAVGGKWKGGHDISGHVFLLVLSSAFLLLELVISDRTSSHPSVSPAAAAAVAADITPEEKRAMGGWESESVAKSRIWTRYFVCVVLALDLWMLLMTAIWFHTWLEKLSGLLIATTCIWGVYFLPRLLPAWRAIVGGV